MKTRSSALLAVIADRTAYDVNLRRTYIQTDIPRSAWLFTYLHFQTEACFCF